MMTSGNFQGAAPEKMRKIVTLNSNSSSGACNKGKKTKKTK